MPVRYIEAEPEAEGFVVSNPAHGGKVDCHKCSEWIYYEQKHVIYPVSPGYDVYFHDACFNPYEHYYGLDKPID